MATIAPAAYDSKVEGNIIVSRLDACINWMSEKFALAHANGSRLLRRSR